MKNQWRIGDHFTLNFGSLNFEFYKNRGVLKHANVASDGGAPDQYHPDILRAHEDRNIACGCAAEEGGCDFIICYPEMKY